MTFNKINHLAVSQNKEIQKKQTFLRLKFRVALVIRIGETEGKLSELSDIPQEIVL